MENAEFMHDFSSNWNSVAIRIENGNLPPVSKNERIPTFNSLLELIGRLRLMRKPFITPSFCNL